jgi:hypothetical protein
MRILTAQQIKELRDIGCKDVMYYQEVIDWFRLERGIVLDVFQEFDSDNNSYTCLWEVDISKLKKYENPHSVLVEKCYEEYYDGMDAGIKAVVNYLKSDYYLGI